jgi:hypothetical protein
MSRAARRAHPVQKNTVGPMIILDGIFSITMREF